MRNKKNLKTIYKNLSISIVLLFFVFFGAVAGVMASEPAVEEDLAQLQFLEAMEERAKGNLFKAQDIFNNVLANQPLLHRARLELAVTFYRLYDYDEARKQAQIVLDDIETPPNVRIAILAFIAQVESDAEAMAAHKHYWRPTIALGWMYDTNVNAGPDGDIVIGGRLLQLDPDSTARNDSAVIAIVSLNHRYSAGRTFRAGQKQGRFFWQSNAGYYRRDYFDEHDFDMGVLTVGSGPAWIVIGEWRANINAQIDYLTLGSDDLAWFYSLLPSITKQYRDGAVEITLDGVVTRRDYQRSIDADRDSTYYAAQLALGRTFKSPKAAVQIGGRLFSENADIGRWSNDGTDIFLGGRWEAWQDGVVRARLHETNTNYDGPAFGFAKNRKDRQIRYIVGISHTLRYKWLNEFILAANFTSPLNSMLPKKLSPRPGFR